MATKESRVRLTHIHNKNSHWQKQKYPPASRKTIVQAFLWIYLISTTACVDTAVTISTIRFALLLSESGGDITAVVIFAMWGGQWEERRGSAAT
jgi:hypothetical protein